MTALSWSGEDLTLKVYVQPKASRDEISGWHDDHVRVRITAAPSDNQANKHLCQFLAKQFGVAKSKVSIMRGHKSRHKTLRILQPAKIPPILA